MLRNFFTGRFFLLALIPLIYFLAVLWTGLFVPSNIFPVGAYVVIPAGATMKDTAVLLEQKGIITSAFEFREYLRFSQNDAYVVAGKYFFDTKINLVDVANRVVVGDYHIPRVKILVPEGTDVLELGGILKQNISDFDVKKFNKLALKEEGYLFPDTYFFFGNVTPEEVIGNMKKNFSEKTKSFDAEVIKSKKSWYEVLTMASIIERETKTPESRRMVSGILWRRIKLGMPLQVDATFSYVNGKSTYDLTLADLDIDSRYNTYEYKGLPPSPICNAGIDAIIATLEPTTSPYLYYLSERNGTMHYAKTFEEHKQNKWKYLK